MKNLFLILFTASLLFAGCGKDNEDNGTAPPPPAENPGGSTGSNDGNDNENGNGNENPIDKTIALNILFIGNSLTNGFIEPAVSYNRTAITDKYGENHGGIPGILKKMCSDNGFTNINIAIAATNGMWLGWHWEETQRNKYRGNWDYVILQDTYDSFLGANGYDAAKVNTYKATINNFLNFFKADNSNVKLVLHEVAAGPHYLTADRWSYYKTIAQMQQVMKEGHATAASELGIDWAPVGEAYQESINNGMGYPNHPTTAPTVPSGKIGLFSAADGYHPGKYGSYLAAAVFYCKLLGDDPRNILTGNSSAAAGLGITAGEAQSLHTAACNAVKNN
jgi:hypothetical protein